MMSVVVGVLETPNRIRTESGGYIPIEGLDMRAAWSWLRLQAGRKIDDEIKEAMKREAEKQGLTALPREDRYKILMNILESFLGSEQRKVQFILSSLDTKAPYVKAVASTAHLLIPPEEVQAVANRILSSASLEILQEPALQGLVATQEGEYAGLKVGLHLDPGDILTRRAISVSSYVQTILCTNPLTWAGIGGFGRFGLKGGRYERILRIQKRSELEPRLLKAVDAGIKNIEKLKSMVEYAKENKVPEHEARVILTAFSKAYGIGDKVIAELLQRLKKEDKTTYGMSQAASWEARHGQAFKENAHHARQSMATIGAASLLIDEPAVTYEKAKRWLGEHFRDWLKRKGREFLGEWT